MSRLTTALCRSSSRAMHGRPAITPPGTDGLLGGEAGLAGEDVDVDEDGETGPDLTETEDDED